MVRVTTTSDVALHLLADVAARFAEERPADRVEILTSFAVLDPEREGIDLALRVVSGELPDSQLTATRLGPVHIGLYAAPRYLARAGSPPGVEALADHAMVGILGGGPLPFPRAPQVATNDAATLLAAVRAGAGIGILPAFAVAEDLALGTVVPVLPSWTAWTGTAWLLSPHGRQAPPRVRAFRTLLLEAVRRVGMLDGSA